MSLCHLFAGTAQLVDCIVQAYAPYLQSMVVSQRTPRQTKKVKQPFSFLLRGSNSVELAVNIATT